MAALKRKRMLITRAEAHRAVYIDFESRVAERPCLLGIFEVDGEARSFQQLNFDPSLKAAANATGVHTKPFRRTMEELVHRALAEEKVIVAWSQHEFDVIRDLGVDEQVLYGVYRNALYTAKAWKNRTYPNFVFKRDPRTGRNSLLNYLKLIEYPVKTDYAAGKTGGRIQTVRDQLAKRNDTYKLLTPVVKAKWTKLLKHNRVDCEGMCAVVMNAMSEA